MLPVIVVEKEGVDEEELHLNDGGEADVVANTVGKESRNFEKVPAATLNNDAKSAGTVCATAEGIGEKVLATYY